MIKGVFLEHIIRNALEEAKSAVENFLASPERLQAIAQASKILLASLKENGRIYSCGNGGSMCDSMHFAEELSGRFRKSRRALGAMSISDPSHLSCVSNDYGYEEVFSRFIDGHGRQGDVLVAISTSGTSPNILKACESAKAVGMKIIAMTGKKPNSPLAELADVEIYAPGGKFSDRVQELHIKIIHIMIELVERELFPQLYS